METTHLHLLSAHGYDIFFFFELLLLLSLLSLLFILFFFEWRS